jgi:hypothetical protein
VIKHISSTSNASAYALSRPDREEKRPRSTTTLLPDQLFVRCLLDLDLEDSGEVEDREQIIAQNHDMPTVGHPGVRQTLSLIARKGHKWKGMRRDVAVYVKGCMVCQKAKPRAGLIPGELHPFNVAGSPWEVMSWDMIGPLPESRTYNAIVTMVNIKTKAIKLEPADITIMAHGIVVIMKNRVFHEEGLLAKIISDRGPQFVSRFMKELYQLLGVEGNCYATKEAFTLIS